MTISYVKLYTFAYSGKPVTGARGENIKLLLEDAGIKHEYERVKFSEYGALKPKLEEKGLLTGTLPAAEIDGKVYSNTVPIMRYISKKEGKYLGSNEDDEQALDALADALDDWHYQMKTQVTFNTKTSEEFFEQVTKKQLTRFEVQYKRNNGPYILGKEISYPDFLLYHIIDVQGFIGKEKVSEKLDEFPALKRFIEHFQKRENIAAYLPKVHGVLLE